MKIQFENFPIVQAVKSKRFPQLNEYFDSQVEYLTLPLHDTISSFKFKNEALIPKLQDARGILMFSKSQFFYKLEASVLTLMHYRGDVPLLKIYVTIDVNGCYSVNENERFSNAKQVLAADEHELDKAYINAVVDMLLRYLCFKQFAEFEVYVVSTMKSHGYSSKKNIGDEQYETEFKFPIRIIDSKYIRTLIRSGEIKVRGHFRFQPYGIGRSQYKLIWIADHIKQKHNILRKDIRHEANCI